MKQTIRQGVWETNSSSVHTLCVRGDKNKDAETILGEIPEEILEWVSANKFYVGRESSFNYPSETIKRFEFKLTSFLVNLISYYDWDRGWINTEYDKNPWCLIEKNIFYNHFKNLLKELGFNIVINPEVLGREMLEKDDVSRDIRYLWQYYYYNNYGRKQNLNGISIADEAEIFEKIVNESLEYSELSTLFLRYLLTDNEVVLYTLDQGEEERYLKENPDLQNLYSFDY